MLLDAVTLNVARQNREKELEAWADTTFNNSKNYTDTRLTNIDQSIADCEEKTAAANVAAERATNAVNHLENDFSAKEIIFE